MLLLTKLHVANSKPNVKLGVRKCIHVSVYAFMESHSTRTRAPKDLSLFVIFHHSRRMKGMQFQYFVEERVPETTGIRTAMFQACSGLMSFSWKLLQRQQALLPLTEKAATPLLEKHTERFFGSM